MRKLLLVLPLILATGLMFFVIKLGYFKEVVIREEIRGPFLMIYKDHIGPYHKIVSNIEEVEKWVKSNGQDCRESFGQYLDNPEVVEEARLKSRGGCILTSKLENIPEPFKYQEIETKKYVVAEFKGSPAIGPMRVYPKIKAYIFNNNLTPDGAVIEIYVIHSSSEMTTTYLFPLKN